MEFFKCSIGGEIYGTGVTEIEVGIAQRNGSTAQVSFSNWKKDNTPYVFFLLLYHIVYFDRFRNHPTLPKKKVSTLMMLG